MARMKKAILLLTLPLFIFNLAYCKIPSQRDLKNCISKTEVNSFKKRFLKDYGSPGYLDGIASGKMKSLDIFPSLSAPYNVLIAKRSSEVNFVFKSTGEKEPKVSTAPPDSACITEFVLRLPEAVRMKCDDHGAYGLFFSFEKQYGKILLTDVNDVVALECEVIR